MTDHLDEIEMLREEYAEIAVMYEEAQKCRRESEAQAAAMREALEQCADLLERIGHDHGVWTHHLAPRVRRALASAAGREMLERIDALDLEAIEAGAAASERERRLEAALLYGLADDESDDPGTLLGRWRIHAREALR